MNLRRLMRWRSVADQLRADGAQIGRDVYISGQVEIDASHRHLVSIGDGASLAPMVLVLTHDASTKHYLGYTRIGAVHIGAKCFIGAGSIILPGVTIGDGTVVGAGSVVSKSLPPGVVASGNPCTVRGTVEDFAARRDAEMGSAPVWPREGWTLDSGITPERMEEQRTALRGGMGYIE